MTTIEQNSRYTTLINVFTVDPDRASDLAALLHTATEEVMRHQPGFRSANIHMSNDGTRVVNYAQWDSEEAYRAMLADPSTQEHMTKAAAMTTIVDPSGYTVES